MTDLGRALARALMAAIFIISGFRKFMALSGTAAYLGSIGVPAPEVMAFVVALVELGGGLMVLVGFKTRWAALLLAVFTAVSIYLGHKFWAVPPEQYGNQFNHALKNLAMIGGFLLLASAGPGRYSVDGRSG